MTQFNESIKEYRKALKNGAVRAAYTGLMGYFDDLRLQLKKSYPDYFLSGNVHYGLMDFTYFCFFPKTLKRQKLKVAIVFDHDKFTFRVLLAGYNKDVQAKYWRQLKENKWPTNYRVASDPKSEDCVMDYVLVESPDFSNLEALTGQIEAGTLKFIRDIEDALSK